MLEGGSVIHEAREIKRVDIRWPPSIPSLFPTVFALQPRCLHVHIYISPFAWLHTCVQMCKPEVGVSLLSPPYPLSRGLSIEPDEPPRLPCIYVGSGVNPNPHAALAIALSTEASPSPACLFVYLL